MKLIYKLFIILLLSVPIFTSSLNKIDEIKIDQKGIILSSLYGFCVSDDNKIILSDWKDGNIKVFDSKGKLLTIYGRRGFGPGEFGQVLQCDVFKNLIIANDNMKKSISVLKLSNNNIVEKLKSFKRRFSCSELRFKNNIILSTGWSINSNGRVFELYSFNINNPKKVNFLVPTEVVFGLSSYNDYKQKKNYFDIIQGRSYCDFWRNTALIIWPGNLNIVKVDLVTKKKIYLHGKKTKKYIKPYKSQKLMESIFSRNLNKVEIVFSKMSIVKKIFAAKNYFGIIYNIPVKFRENNKEHMCQIYDYSGNFISEVEIHGEYLSHYYFHNNGKYLYSLVSEPKKDLDEDIIITKYEVKL